MAINGHSVLRTSWHLSLRAIVYFSGLVNYSIINILYFDVQGTTQDTREEIQGAKTQREHANEPLELNPSSSRKGAAEPPDKTKKTQ